jgi:molybdenum cofactor guanylyltransferase
MGRDKARIEIDGVPIVRRVYNAVAGCPEIAADRIYVVTPWAQRYRSLLPTSCQFMLEPQPTQGPLVALAIGLAAIATEWTLVVACDLPNLSSECLRSGISSLPSLAAENMAYLPSNTSKGWEPLCGFYRTNCRASLHSYIADGGRSFQGWLQENNVTAWEISDRNCLFNCNTPADLEAI